ncbi:hypothetical protein QJS10_CPB17g01745 [Acorus calamus]|uniref:peptide-methionine (S)-S-oxide reductase n=1 Tax=Acorus calamus TaxID=4465 RepID=A0AAV9CXU4_ACOCL|nr:hypothetical protein QJS10_CPB17g01745 [Acorus calamus]
MPIVLVLASIGFMIFFRSTYVAKESILSISTLCITEVVEGRMVNWFTLTLGNDVGTQYQSGIYFYTPEQEKAARESLERQQKLLNGNIVTEILPAKKFYRAEEYHQQYLAKGGCFGFKQSTEKGCNDPIRCYG